MQSRLLTIKEQWLLLGVGVAIAFGASVLLWRGHAGARGPEGAFPAASLEALPEAPSQSVAVNSALSAPAPPLAAPVALPVEPSVEKIGVGILGAVNRPGLYFFSPDSRVKDLIARAGGTLPESDLSDINRTALLIDETTLLIPWLVVVDGVTYRDPAEPHNPAPYTRSTWYRLESGGVDSGVAASEGGVASPGGRINLNTASQQELESLPGIGPATAVKIMAYRAQQPFSQVGDLEKVSGIGPAKMAAVRDLVTVE